MKLGGFLEVVGSSRWILEFTKCSSKVKVHRSQRRMGIRIQLQATLEVQGCLLKLAKAMVNDATGVD